MICTIKPACAALLLGAVLIAAPVTAKETAPVRIFDAGELTLSSYTVVKRLWTGSWRALFEVPFHKDAAAAIQAINDEATSVGADGIINLHCLSDNGAWLITGYTCYGLAIRLR